MERIRSLDSDTILEAYKKHGSISGALKEIGVTSRAPCVRQCIKEIITRIDGSALRKLAIRNNYTINDVQEAVLTSICMSDVLRKVGLSTHGSNASTLRKLIVAHNISMDHFDVIASKQRNKHRWVAEDIFVEHSQIPRSSLHAHVKRRGILGEPLCTECGVTNEYNGKPIALTIDHINGVSDDNRVENLRWLCPNCHSQTLTYAGKGKRKV